ncbi:MAG: GvpL/GvpF family gas vesicle protein [Chloroflexota bacterium]
MGATYVYAIIPTGNGVVFEAAGVDDHHDEVYSIPNRDIAAVVSASPLADYRGLKRDEAVPYLVAHQRVVEAIMRDFPMLPVKFGTVLPNEAWVHRLLRQGETLFRTTLKRFAGRVQMEVVVLWSLPEVFQEIGNELRSNVQTFKLSNVTDAERIAIGQMVQASLAQRRTALRDRLLPSLQEVALDLVVNPLMDDSMVANVALLVDEAGRRALDQRLELLDNEFGGRLRFRCVGPLPPYSFATVEVQMPSFQAVDEARRLLGLGETATPGEIKRSYHQLAGQLHPDHNPEDPEAEVHMAELTQAYRLLTAYAENVHRPPATDRRQLTPAVSGQPPAVVFSREAVERTLLIAIRRQEAPVQGTRAI